jgi:hypothetical protein
MSREKRIRVSPDEKEQLRSVAERRFGTTDVPFGHVVSTLATDYLEGGDE